ncbi:MAG: DNA-binding protein [Candidatus Micrarchaeota archaeon]|nr:DNA-binding protein [Candidatus Micrarchaeota archaeon]
MHYSRLNNKTFLVRLEKGETVNASVKRFCESNKVSNAYFFGLGSIENPILAHYRVDNRAYKEKPMQGIYEITSLIGTVGMFEGSPLPHSHITVSDDEMRAFGGHLVETVVSATVELVLKDLESAKTKKHSDEIGLKLFELDERM